VVRQSEAADGDRLIGFGVVRRLASAGRTGGIDTLMNPLPLFGVVALKLNALDFHIIE
jgi:hypothetical protein